METPRKLWQSELCEWKQTVVLDKCIMCAVYLETPVTCCLSTEQASSVTLFISIDPRASLL